MLSCRDSWPISTTDSDYSLNNQIPLTCRYHLNSMSRRFAATIFSGLSLLTTPYR